MRPDPAGGGEAGGLYPAGDKRHNFIEETKEKRPEEEEFINLKIAIHLYYRLFYSVAALVHFAL